MAKITGELPTGERIEFTLSGLATSEQMQELLLAFKKRIEKAKQEDKEAAERLRELGRETTDLNENFKDLNDQSEKYTKSLEDLTDIGSSLTRGFGALNQRLARTSNSFVSNLALAGGALTGWVMSLGSDVQQGLQLGIAGGIMDFAIAAKTAGVDVGTFTTALKESGGGFASLGKSATDGAKQFGALVSSVRYATATVGNLGLSNEQLAGFTARQTRIAVQQGFKGKQAQELVSRNSRILSEEIANLSSATGKSVLELTEAAAKLATDPLVSSFVSTAKLNGKNVSIAVQTFAANLNGLFGEAGDALSADALKSAIAGLPFAMTKSGTNMLIASSAMYTELERQSKEAAAGISKSAAEQEADRKRLRDIAMREYSMRSQEINQLSMLEGPAGEAARQLLKLKSEAEFYNTEAGRRSQQEKKSAAEFNASLNQFKANLTALAVPFLNLLNSVNWTMFIDVFKGVTKAVEILLTPLNGLAAILEFLGPVGSALGTFVGLVLGVGVIFTGLKNAAMSLKGVFTSLEKTAGGMKRVLLPQSDRTRRYRDIRTSDPTVRASDALAKARLDQKLTLLGKAAGALATTFVGTQIAAYGESLLREDANSMMGKFLVGLGSVTEGLGVLLPFIGPMAPLFTKLGGALAAVSSSVIASGGALVAALGRATAWLAGSLVAGLQVLGEYALLAGGKLLMFARTAIGVASRSLISFSATLGRAIVAMVPALVTGAVALWGFISPLLVAAAPFIAVGAAVAAAGAALWYFWDEIKELGGKLWDGIKVIPTMLWDRIKSIGSTIADIPGMIWNGVKSIGSTIADIPSMLWDGVKSIGSSIADIPSMLWNGVKSIGSSLVSLPKILFEGATDVFTGIGDAVYSVISAPFEWLSNTLDTVLAPFTSLFDVIVSPFKAFKEWLANSFIGKMLGMGDDKKEDQKKIKENETREQYIRRRSAEMIESGEVKPITDSRNGKKSRNCKSTFTSY